jgi:hypothetical protein
VGHWHMGKCNGVCMECRAKRAYLAVQCRNKAYLQRGARPAMPGRVGVLAGSYALGTSDAVRHDCFSQRAWHWWHLVQFSGKATPYDAGHPRYASMEPGEYHDGALTINIAFKSIYCVVASMSLLWTNLLNQYIVNLCCWRCQTCRDGPHQHFGLACCRGAQSVRRRAARVQ